MHVDAPGNCEAPFSPPLELTFAHAHRPILTLQASGWSW